MSPAKNRPAIADANRLLFTRDLADLLGILPGSLPRFLKRTPSLGRLVTKLGRRTTIRVSDWNSWTKALRQPIHRMARF